MDLCITGRWIDAREALFVGLVAEVVPALSLNARAFELAQALGRLPREQAALVKLAIWDGLELPIARRRSRSNGVWPNELRFSRAPDRQPVAASLKRARNILSRTHSEAEPKEVSGP